MLVTTAEAERYIYENIETNSIISKKATRIAYETFICTALDEEEMTSLIWIARAYVWMTCVVENLQRLLKVIGRGGREIHVLKT